MSELQKVYIQRSVFKSFISELLRVNPKFCDEGQDICIAVLPFSAGSKPLGDREVGGFSGVMVEASER